MKIDQLLLDAQNGTNNEFDYVDELIPESQQEDFTSIKREVTFFQLGEHFPKYFIHQDFYTTNNQSISTGDDQMFNREISLMNDHFLDNEHHDIMPTRILPQNATSTKKPIKKRLLEENFSESDSEQDFSSSLQKKHIIKKAKKVKKLQYPTKNFLPSFRTSFINYLSPHFPRSQFEDMEIIRKIRGKKCINLKDYEQLFNTEKFRPILETYFNDRVIYRDLMSSRIETKTKAHYSGKVWVFERAFKTREFEKIN